MNLLNPIIKIIRKDNSRNLHIGNLLCRPVFDNSRLNIMVSQMLMDIENPQVRRITTIGGGKADIFMVKVPEGAKVAGKSVQNIVESRHFPSECVFVAVYDQKTEQFSIPRGKQEINEGNELFLISAAENIKKAVDFLTAKKRN